MGKCWRVRQNIKDTNIPCVLLLFLLLWVLLSCWQLFTFTPFHRPLSTSNPTQHRLAVGILSLGHTQLPLAHFKLHFKRSFSLFLQIIFFDTTTTPTCSSSENLLTFFHVGATSEFLGRTVYTRF